MRDRHVEETETDNSDHRGTGNARRRFGLAERLCGRFAARFTTVCEGLRAQPTFGLLSENFSNFGERKISLHNGPCSKSARDFDPVSPMLNTHNVSARSCLGMAGVRTFYRLEVIEDYQIEMSE